MPLRLRRPTPILRIAFGAIMALAIGALALWLVWALYVPHYRPSLAQDEVFGVDVSNHQGDIDWEAVAADDITFAYIKSTEGGDYVDAYFRQNWDAAQAAGIDVGAYHFFTFCRSGADQAANVLATVPIEDMDLPLALDLEFGGNCSARPSLEWMQREVTTFIELIEAATGEPLLLYIIDEFDEAYELKEPLDRALWERRLWRRPKVDNWTFWQFSFRSAVDGIDGGVDLNVGRPSPPSS